MNPTYFKDGYLFFRDPIGVDQILGDSLIVDPEKLEEIISYIKYKKVKTISINTAFFKVENLEFLKDISFIEGLFILQDDIDTSNISILKDLKVLRINKLNTTIDFKNFQKLEVLGITYNKHIKNIGSCSKLFWLWMDNFKESNLLELRNLINLQYLILYKSSINNLEYLGGLSQLKELHIDTASKLTSLYGITDNNSRLEFLDIHGAKNLRDYNSIRYAKTLKKIWFSRTGEIDNLSFLNDLPSLENATIGMKVLDGDMSHLKRVSSVGFVDYPHYNFKMKDFKK